MKNLFLIILLFCSVSSFAQWIKIPVGTTENLHHIYFKDSQTGFCVGGGDVYGFPMTGTKGIVLKTSDGGNIWNKIYEDSTVALREVIAKDNIVIAAGSNNLGKNIFLKSLDNGLNWSVDTIGYPARSLQYFDNDQYFLDTSLKKISISNIQNLLNDVVLYDNQAGELFCITYSNIPSQDFDLVFSSDQGNNWTTKPINISLITSNSLGGSSLWTFGDTIVFLANYPAAIAYSYNKGDTWTEFLAIMSGDAFMTSSEAIIHGATSKIIRKSTDGGHTSFQQDTTTDRISKFFFINENLGFLCGENGMIYKTTNGGGTTSIRETKQLKKNISIYPNPTKNNIEIKHEAGIIIQKIQLCDINGKLIKEQKGSSNVLDIEDIAAGNYLITIQTNKGEIMEKVIID